jgi:SAM-dependent methyltransferase
MEAARVEDPLPADEHAAVVGYLTQLYAGVFGAEEIAVHVRDYVGPHFGKMALSFLTQSLAPGARVLDVGAGFGTFVLLARQAGFDAMGIEQAAFEVEFARRRLSRLRQEDDPKRVYRCGDAHGLELTAASLDAVTFWNVLEHIRDYRALLADAARMLRPGGSVFIICPNYAAFRQEAHYQVPWIPLLPRRLASVYLRRQGRNPNYFETGIFYRTHWGVLWTLKRLGFEVFRIDNTESMDLKPGNLPRLLRHPLQLLRFYNPFVESVVVAARTGTR